MKEKLKIKEIKEFSPIRRVWPLPWPLDLSLLTTVRVTIRLSTHFPNLLQRPCVITWAGSLSPGSPGVVFPSRSLLFISSSSFSLFTKLSTLWLAFWSSYVASWSSVFSWAISFWANAYLSRISENWKFTCYNFTVNPLQAPTTEGYFGRRITKFNKIILTLRTNINFTARKSKGVRSPITKYHILTVHCSWVWN